MTRKREYDAFTPAKQGIFFEHLREGYTVRSAASIAGVTTTTVYTWRKNDPDFAIAWSEAERAGFDRLHAAAIERATRGVKKLVIQGGKIIHRYDAERDEFVPVYEINYSDSLLMFLLKARDPLRFCDRARTAHIERRWAKADAEAGAGADAIADDDVVAMLNDIAERKAATADAPGE